MCTPWCVEQIQPLSSNGHILAETVCDNICSLQIFLDISKKYPGAEVIHERRVKCGLCESRLLMNKLRTAQSLTCNNYKYNNLLISVIIPMKPKYFKKQT